MVAKRVGLPSFSFILQFSFVTAFCKHSFIVGVNLVVGSPEVSIMAMANI